MRTFRYSQIWTIAYPILLSTLMEQLIGMTDAAFLGRVGEVELGASALGGIFYVTIFMIGLGFSIGAQILMGRRNGEGRYEQIGIIFYHCIAFLLLLSLLLFAVTRWFAPSLLESIIRSHQVFEATDSYLQWRICGLAFAFVNALFRAFYVAITQPRTLTINSLVMVMSNILFNYSLIFGHFGLPAMGISGAAIGSALAECVSLIFFVFYTRSHISGVHYGFHRLPRLRMKLFGNVLDVGCWVMLQNFLSLSTWFLFFLGVEHLGERSLAATNIIRNISSFTFMTVIALSSTASTLVSNLMGQRESGAVWPMLKKTISLGFLILSPVLVLIGLFPTAVMHIFTNDDTLIAEALPALYVLLTSYVFTIPAQILLHAVSGTGNTRTGLLFEFLSLTVYCIYVGVAIYGYGVSLFWCWVSEHVYHILALLFCYSYMRWGNWQHKKI